VFSDDPLCIEPFDVLRVAAAEDLIGFVMLMRLEDDEHGRGVRTEDIGGTDRDHLVGAAVPQLLIETLGELDRADQPLGGSIEIIRRNLCAVLNSSIGTSRVSG